MRSRNQYSVKRPAKQGREEAAAAPEPNKIGASTPYNFSGKNLTPYGGLLPVATMLEKLGFRPLVEQTLTVNRLTRVMDLYQFVLAIVLGLKPKQTSLQAPWQNGVSERWMGSCRREILDHVIPLNQEHLRRLIRDYVGYYREDRIHDSLDKGTPNRRPIQQKPSLQATVISSPRLGGLQHRYSWRQAA